MKAKKLKGTQRGLASKDAHRITDDIPLIVDTTEYITPEVAEKLLQKNKCNRPVSWNKVEQYRKMMENGEWRFHSQGIVLDEKGSVLTGQKRLWAVIYSGKPQYFRVSKGTPSNLSHLIDRGTPQSSRDLASRKTERKHSPTEGSIVRAMYAIEGKIRPSVDDIADGIVEDEKLLAFAMYQTKGLKKVKSVMMIMAAICHLSKVKGSAKELFAVASELSEELANELLPIEPEKCWNKGAAFNLAMSKAIDVCKKFVEKK